MVLLEQIEALIDYLENNSEVALGHINRTKEGRIVCKRHWATISNILNNVIENCPSKTPEEWRTFYTEYKCKTIKKIRAQKSELSATGGGRAKKIVLTPLQERLFNILGRDVGDPLPGVRIDPLFQGDISHGHLSSSLQQTFEINQQETAQLAPPSPQQTLAITEPDILEFELSSLPPPFGEINNLPTSFGETNNLPTSFGETNNLPTSFGETNTLPTSIGQVNNLPPATPNEATNPPNEEHNEPPPRRRRRQRPIRRQQTIDNDNETLNASQERLERIEQRHSEAILEQARSINRLAAAIERAVDRLAEPLIIVVRERQDQQNSVG